MLRLYGFFSLLLMLSACSAPAPLFQPTEQMAQTSGVKLADLQQGRTLYVASCSGCHTLYTAETYTKTEWTTNLNKMQRKAKISDGEKALIYNYLRLQAKP